MLKKINDIFKKTAGSKAFWIGVLLCLTFTVATPVSAIAEEYDCPSMDVLRERYQGDCFPCQIVNVLLSSFMRAASKTYEVSREAGNKLLFLGAILWVAFWALKKMSSLANVEPASMTNELVIFLSKIVVAYCFINAGISTLVNYAINPILGAGADFGTALLIESNNMKMNEAPKSENQYTGPDDVVKKSTMDKILKLSEGVSNEVAMNLIIGNALTCFSIKEGFHIDVPLIITIHIPDIWLWLVGAAIWCVGFMLVLSVCYYLIDIPFKIGFAIIALPVVIGLWPFKITTGKLSSVVKIAFNAAGTFLFLALSSSYAMRLLESSFSTVNGLKNEDTGEALNGTDALFYAFQSDNVKYVENVFTITSASFLIIMFCYIYAIKMISKITNEYPNKFFNGSMMAGAGSPLHHMATAATMWASNKVAAPFKMAGDIVAHQAGKAATTAAKAAGNVGIGIAGATVGQAAKLVTKPLQKGTRGLANLAQKGRNAMEAKQQRDRDNGAGVMKKAVNILGVSTARLGSFTANTVAKAADYVDDGRGAMSQVGMNTFNRVRNAWSLGTSELGDAAAELAGQLPEGLGQAMQGAAEYHNELAQQNERLRGGNKIGAMASRAIGRAFNQVGSKIVENQPSADETRTRAREEFAAATAKFGESGRKLATYVPKWVGETVRGFGFYYTANAEYSNNPVEAYLSSKLGAALTKTGSGIVDNRPEAETIRHKLSNLKVSKLKTVFSGKAIRIGIGKAWGGIRKALDEGIVKPWQTDVADLKDSLGKTKDDLTNFGSDITEKWNVSAESMGISAGSFRGGLDRMKADISGAYGELKESATGFGQTLASEHGLNHASGSSTRNQVATGGAALAGTIAGSTLGGGLATMGVGAVAGRHLYNNIKEATQETIAAWKDGKIDDLFDLAGAVAHPVMAIPIILNNTASQTLESTYQVAEKAILAGLDVALTATSVLKEPGRDIAHLANIVGNGAKMVATPVMAGVNVALDVGEAAVKGVRTIARPLVNTVATVAFAPVGFAAKAVDETLYTAYKMTVRPVATIGTAAVRGAKVLYKGAELGVKSTKVGRGAIRTFKAGSKALKVCGKTLKLGRDLIRAAAGEGGYSNEPLTQEEKEQRRRERRMRRQAERQRERERREAREREEQETQQRLEEFRRRQEEEDAQRRAEEEAARQAAQAEAERREAVEAASAQSETEQESNHYQPLRDAIDNEEIDGVKNYSKDDLQSILDTHERLLNGTNNGTTFESLHENSVSDLQKFAEGKLTIDQDSYATMVPFIRTFGTDDRGQLTDVGRAAQQKLTNLMTGGGSRGSSGGTGTPH